MGSNVADKPDQRLQYFQLRGAARKAHLTVSFLDVTLEVSTRS
jgi:hypothetical protein